MNNVIMISMSSILLVLFLALPLYIAQARGFFLGFILLAVQIVVGTTAYYSFGDAQSERVFIAYERGRNAEGEL